MDVHREPHKKHADNFLHVSKIKSLKSIFKNLEKLCSVLLSTAQYYSVLPFFSISRIQILKADLEELDRTQHIWFLQIIHHTESSWAILSENPEQNPELAQYQNPKNEFESLGGW